MASSLRTLFNACSLLTGTLMCSLSWCQPATPRLTKPFFQGIFGQAVSHAAMRGTARHEVDLAGHFPFNPLCRRITPKNLRFQAFPEVAEIIGQLGEELAFVAPNQDAGLLPINRFIMDLEELAETEVPPSLTAGLQGGARVVGPDIGRSWQVHRGVHPQLQRVAYMDDFGLAGLGAGDSHACLPRDLGCGQACGG